MTKKQLIDCIAKESDLTKKEITQTVDQLFAAIEASLNDGEAVQISGFGTFCVKEKAAYVGRNPKTNEPVNIPASKRATFSAGKALKDKLNAAR